MSDPVPAPAGTRRRLFLHCVGSPVPGHDRYAERGLVLARGDDVVCVPRGIEPEYLGFLSALGLGPAAANVITAPTGTGEAGRSLVERLLHAEGMVEVVARRLGAMPVTIHPYAGTAGVFALARALERVSCSPVRVHAARPDLLDLVDQRQLMRARAAELGIPVADGEVAELASPFGRRRRDLEPLRLAIGRQLRCTGRVIVRGAAGGPSTFLVGPGGEDIDEVLRRIALTADNRAYLVEVLVDATVCSTVHLRVEPDGGGLTRLGISDRRLGRGLASAGSRYPSAARTAESMTGWAELFAEWLRDAGYAGLVGFDFVEYRDSVTGEPRSFLAGVDPRANEGTYALALKDEVGAPAFVSGMVTARAPSFGRLRETLGGLLYDPDRGSGVIPYATGCLDQGRCPMVALGPGRLHASELLGKAQAALETVWTRS